jgi:PAS domain S-box-containing protein
VSALLTWPVVGSLGSGVGTLYLQYRLLEKRDQPGATWFLVSLAFQAVWCFAYALALVTFEPSLRWTFEVLSWAAMSATGVSFLTFALQYTGRGSVVQHRWYPALFSVPVATTVLAVTNARHHLLWSGFEVRRVLDVAGASYHIEPLAFLLVGTGTLFATVGSGLLLETVVSYGPLYRREAVAVGLSTLPPGVALLAWLFGLGPVPALNLTPVFFLPHVLLDGYAFVASDMFEFHPVTRRVGERTAVEDLGSPVVIVDEAERIVDLNAAAESTFGVGEERVLTMPVRRGLGIPETVALDDGDTTLTVARNGHERTFRASPAALHNATGDHVGYSVVFQDVTEEVRRKQRLEVLNRVLRHNLRNDLSVVRELLGEGSDRATSTDVTSLLTRAEDRTESMLTTSEKARDLERLLQTDEPQRPVDVGALLADVAADAEATHSGTVEVRVPVGLQFATNPPLVRAAFESLVENSLLHADGGGHVVVELVAETDDDVSIVVRDDGPGIPPHELSALERGQEDALSHGSGLGLWVADWAVTTLGGSLSFETGRDGTVATVRLPTDQ